MARLSKSDFEKYDPTTLTGRADALQKIVDGVGYGADDSSAAQKNARNNFQGTAADAIDAQATTDVSSLHQFHDSVEGARKAYADGAAKLAPSVNGVRDVLRDAQQQGFEVLDNWQLKDTKRSGSWRAQAQSDLQHRLDSAVTTLDQADEEVASDVSKADLALGNVPKPAVSFSAPAPEQPPAQPDQPKPEDHPQEQDQPGAPQQHDGLATGPNGEHPDTLPDGTQGRHFAPVQAFPNPGPGIDPSKSPDDQWRAALAQYKPGDPLPSPQSVKDSQLRMVAAMASQQGTAYAWAGGHAPKGPGPTKGTDGVTGMDCSGAVRYAVSQAYGFDPGGLATNVGTPTMLTSPHYEHVSGLPQTGDIVVCEGGQHTAVCIGGNPPMFIDASTSGQPLAPTKGWWGSGDQQVLRPKP